jgi:predicted Rossmann fold nucleotide-binding protein DprA/Smf involved in DNA uptake
MQPFELIDLQARNHARQYAVDLMDDLCSQAEAIQELHWYVSKQQALPAGVPSPMELLEIQNRLGELIQTVERWLDELEKAGSVAAGKRLREFETWSSWILERRPPAPKKY